MKEIENEDAKFYDAFFIVQEEQSKEKKRHRRIAEPGKVW